MLSSCYSNTVICRWHCYVGPNAYWHTCTRLYRPTFSSKVGDKEEFGSIICLLWVHPSGKYYTGKKWSEWLTSRRRKTAYPWTWLIEISTTSITGRANARQRFRHPYQILFTRKDRKVSACLTGCVDYRCNNSCVDGASGTVQIMFKQVHSLNLTVRYTDSFKGQMGPCP